MIIKRVYQLLGVILLSLSVIFYGCVTADNQYSTLPPGIWHGQLDINEPGTESDIVAGERSSQSSSSNSIQIPFNFTVGYVDGKPIVNILNGNEAITVQSIDIGRDPRTAKDTIQIRFPEYDTHIEGFYEENYIQGYWVVHYRDHYRIPFFAVYGQDHRFRHTPNVKPKDFNGVWKTTFSYENEEAYPAIAEFYQDGDTLRGTFRTETGDYRYLEGVVRGDKMFLSAFDGAHAFLFTGKLIDGEIFGEFRSGKHYKTTWRASREEEVSLKDPYEMTKSLTNAPVDFQFPNTQNKMISLDEAAFRGKVKLINIMGTWCPNCRDEIEFLKDFYGTIDTSQIQIISLSFEKYRDKDRALEIIETYKERLGVPWPILLGGFYDKQDASAQLTFLDRIISYPTLLFLDKTNRIRYIHTGFNGPATSRFAAFKQDFNAKIQSLLNE